MWMRNGRWSSSRSGGKTSTLWYPSAIPAWGCPRSRRTRSSMRSSPPNLMAPAWDFGSAARSLNHMAAACGPRATPGGAQRFSSHCLPQLRCAQCRHMATLIRGVHRNTKDHESDWRRDVKNYDQTNLAEEDKAPQPASLTYGFAVPGVAIAFKQCDA